MSSTLGINAAGHETRVALVENGHIAEFYLERKKDKGIVGNIYKGRVVRVLPGMQAAFVDIGLEKSAFLYVSEVVYDPDFAKEQFDLTEGEHEEEVPEVPDVVEGEVSAQEAAPVDEAPRDAQPAPAAELPPAPSEEKKPEREAKGELRLREPRGKDSGRRNGRSNGRSLARSARPASRTSSRWARKSSAVSRSIGSKGARSPHISIPGRHLVFMPTLNP